jgi:uncharacterized protein YjiS (DUF1127 family)
MFVFEEPKAERRALPGLISAAASAEPGKTGQRSPAILLAARVVDHVRRLAAGFAEWRRRRARPRLASWMAMDPRVLADIGVARADVQAVVYGGVPFAQLAARRSVEESGGEVLVTPRPWRAKLCLVASDDLGAAA